MNELFSDKNVCLLNVKIDKKLQETRVVSFFWLN